MRLLPEMALIGLGSLMALLHARSAEAGSRPNVVLILTDDQDAHMDSIEHMEQVQKHLVDEGTTFDKHYCTIAICCPSRVNIWTGQMAHNTNVTNVQPPWGGYPKFIEGGYNDHHLALWMQKSGYNTYYVGKLFNGHSIDNYDSPPMSGYTGSEFFLEPFTYQYYNVSSTRNGKSPHNEAGKYSTDLVSDYGMDFLEDGLKEDDPFFLTLAPVAPHAYLTEYPKTKGGPPVPAKRHRHLFEDYKIPRTDNFNPDSPSGVNWVAKLPKLDDDEIEQNDKVQRRRLQSLQSVDEMVERVVDRLDEAGVLDNTFIIYTTDNGYHISQHRMKPGKSCGYETDINVPFIIRGPGVPAGHTRQDPSSHTDLAPTIMQLAGNSIDDKKFDGSPMNLDEVPQLRPSEHVAVEFWGVAGEESVKGVKTHRDNTYKGLRVEAEKYSFYYSVWCNNAKEMYDMKADPGQLDNLLSSDGSAKKRDTALLFDQDVQGVADRLDSLMMVLKSCKESSCSDPWRSLHPDGSVKSLEDALQHRYNSFYQDQDRVSYSRCEGGFLIDAEGSLSVKSFNESSGEESGASRMGMVINPYWHWWE